jgi:chromosome segregation ATPase
MYENVRLFNECIRSAGSARQQRVTQALQQIEAANLALRDGPQKVQQCEQRLAKGKEAAAQNAKTQEEAQAKLAARESLAKQSAELLKNLEAALAKEPQKEITPRCGAQSSESLDIVNAELAANREAATAAAAAAKTAEAERASAEAALNAARAELPGAPKQLEDAKRTVTSSVGDESARVKERVDRLIAEQNRLQKQT